MKMELLRFGQKVNVYMVGTVQKIERTPIDKEHYYDSVTILTKEGSVLVKPEHLEAIKG